MTRLQLLRKRLAIVVPEPQAPARKGMTMTISATATVPTDSASKYLQQLCKHWQHNLAVEFTPEHGTIVFPKDARGADWPADALVTLDARATALDVRIDASSAEQLTGLEGAVARHLDRFAFREAPLPFDWKPA